MPTSDRRKQLIDTGNVLINLVRHILQRRALEKTDRKPHLVFWIVINNALFDAAVLDWCKLFGSDDEEHQPTHWKNVVPDHDEFRRRLVAAVGTSRKQWDRYWEQMKGYRDRAVAHHDKDRSDIKAFPHYDLALKSAYFYYGRVRQMLLDDGLGLWEPEDLEAYSTAFFDQADVVASAAISATSSIREGVG